MEKMRLMCVEAGKSYVDHNMDIWDSIACTWAAWELKGGNRECALCGGRLEDGFGYIRQKDNAGVHDGCTEKIYPQNVFGLYEAVSGLEDFRHVLKAANKEFVHHQEKKGDDWLQCEFNDLFTGLAKGYAELILATTEQSADSFSKSYIETLKLMLMCMMVAERYRRMILEDEDEDYIPY